MVTQRTLPTGTVTFLFTDIEGSTKLVQDFGDSVGALFEAHAAIVRAAIADHGGIEVNTEGDAFFCVFTSAADAVAAAVEIQRRLHDHDWPSGGTVRIRIGLHTGVGTVGGDDYFGIDVHRASRIADTGHGGQIVISEATRGAVVGNDLPSGVAVRDLGMHRMKDLTSPEHLSDLVVDGLPDDFPRLRSLRMMGTQLPTPLSSFIGRDADVETVVELLEQQRMVTLVGPGGIGKSRLSLRVAEAVADRFDAVFFVSLASVGDPNLVAATILRALGDPPSGQDSTVRLHDLLAHKRWLLVLDNFEHVVDAAGLVASALAAAPEVTVLATSQIPLRIAGEHEYSVLPLSLATDAVSGDPLDSEAVQLFIDRATAVRPDLELTDETVEAIVEITAALDGIPLAIELAAARVRVLPPVALRHRMGSFLDLLSSGSREVDPRQQTLRGAIGWSYDLLTESQQRLLEDFSVFRGGATLDAIEAACGLEREYWEWLEGLEALVSHSLVTRVENESSSRFVLYEMVRAFAAEKLVERGTSDAVAEQHFEWFLDVARRASAGLMTADQGTWLTTLDDERDNLLAALEWAMDRGDAHRSAQMVFALWRFWHMRGPIPEGADRVEKILTMETLESPDRMLALEAAGGLAWWSGDLDTARARYGESVEVARSVGDEWELANALYNSGLALGFGDASGRGRDALEEALAIGERLDDDLIRARCYWGLSSIHQIDDEFERSIDQLRIALALFKSEGDEFMVQWTNRELGAAEMALGELQHATVHLAESLEFFSSTGDRSGILLLLRDHARMAAIRGDQNRALRLLGATTERERESRLNLGQFELEALGLENPIVITDQEAADRLLEEGKRWSIDQAVAYALAGRANGS